MSSNSLMYMRADTPYKTIEDVRSASTPPKCGATGVTSSAYYMPKLLEDAIGTKFEIVSGYVAGSDIDLAVERGEVQCRAFTINAYFAREPFITWRKKNFVRVLYQTGSKRDPRLKDVPLFNELMDKYKTPENVRRLDKVVVAADEFGRPIVFPPGVPADRVKIIRDAFNKTINDPALLAEAEKRRLDIDPATWRGTRRFGQRSHDRAAGRRRTSEKTHRHVSRIIDERKMSHVAENFKERKFKASLFFFIVIYLNPLEPCTCVAQTPFYQGKTIRIVIGSSTGGGYDLWARVLARYYGKYIPGNPTILVQNMPGAASIVATNYLYNVAKPDGLTLGAILPAIYFDQLVGRPEVKFDFAKIGWIGSPEQNDILHYMRADLALSKHRRYPQGQRAAPLRQFGHRHDRILHPAPARRSFGHETYHRQRLRRRLGNRSGRRARRSPLLVAVGGDFFRPGTLHFLAQKRLCPRAAPNQPQTRCAFSATCRPSTS